MSLGDDGKKKILQDNIDVLDCAVYDAEVAKDVSAECGESDALTKATKSMDALIKRRASYQKRLDALGE